MREEKETGQDGQKKTALYSLTSARKTWRKKPLHINIFLAYTPDNYEGRKDLVDKIRLFERIRSTEIKSLQPVRDTQQLESLSTTYLTMDEVTV